MINNEDKFFPYYAWQTVTVLEKAAGWWPFQNRTKNMTLRLMHFGNLLLIIIMCSVRLFQEYKQKKLYIVVENTVILVMIICTKMKVIMFFINEKQRKIFYENVLIHWKDTNDEEEMMILKQYAKLGLKTIINYAIFLVSVNILFQGVPVLSDVINYLNDPNITYLKKELPIYIEVYIDQEKYFYQLYVVLFFMTCAALLLAFSHELTFFQSVQHINAMFKIIEIRIIRLSKIVKRTECGLDTFKEADRKIFVCISRAVDLHNAVLNNIKFINSSFGATYLVVLLFNCLIFGASLFLIFNNSDQKIHLIRYGLVFLGLSVHFFIIFWPGQKIMDGSESLFNVCCSCDWYKLSKRSKNLLRIMMLKSVMQCQITASGMFVLSFETYVKLFKTGLSFVAVFS
ncbi:odorant receptor 207 isoform X2 [Nasonia vitripennis]|uniref:Odorant receptor n=1 Tax=Nasonia vitripennis TaxID=7425 RepID=A0A7M7IY89_NASVI|nr:odorant receptor 207 isoform X2 [Nasonia vitripennis]